MTSVLNRPDLGMMDTCLAIGDATRAQMMRGIETFLAKREHNDCVLVYLTGYANVSRQDGQLYFVAKDTNPADLEQTAVSADFLRRQLQECRAASKVVLLDYCDSWLTEPVQPAAELADSSPSQIWQRHVMPEPAGVYVISASGPPQPLAAMTPSDTFGMSRFTSAIVQGLQEGKVKSGLGRWVTADDLSAYLTARLGELGTAQTHLPVTSTLAVSGNHVIARSATRALSLLDTANQSAERPAAAPVLQQPDDGSKAAERPGWLGLITYYRACLGEAQPPEELPSRDDQSATLIPIESGPEVLLTGTGATTPAPAGVDTFDWKDRDVWYGYPIVTLASGGRRHSASPLQPPTVAPLLVQRVDVTIDARGAATLRRTGPVMPHAGVLRACLDDQEAASVLASWQQNWRPGDDVQMLQSVRQLIKRLELTELESLDLRELTPAHLRTATRTSVHNAACVLYAESTRPASLAVSAELGKIAEAVGEIPGTALGQLHQPRPTQPVSDTGITLVTPADVNETHETVLTSAMSRPLTVVKAPPGTGKERLIVDLVATATAAGQTVLVASSDDRTLQRLTARCADLAPGLLIKTGDAQARAEEKHLLRQLLRSAKNGPRHRHCSTIVAELTAAWTHLHAWRDQLTERADLDARLRRTSVARGVAAGRLGVSTAVTGSVWPDNDAGMDDWIERAHARTTARLFGRWRRKRSTRAYLRAATAEGLDWGSLRKRLGEPEAFEAVLLAARAEQQLRKDRQRTQKLTDDHLAVQGQRLGEDIRELSAELIDARIAEQVTISKARLEARRRALEPGGRERLSSQRELMRDMRGWAVSVEAAQQLRLEPGMFDLVVLDDAHRCSVASAMPILFRGRRAVVIGDPVRRHQSITTGDHRLRRAREQAGVSATWLETAGLTYQAGCAYEAAAKNADTVTLLDEHAECHPGIARIVDETFYDGRLTVTTDVKALRRARDPETGQSTVLLWEDVHGTPERGPNGGSWRNQAELDRVVWAVNELRDHLPGDATVAVMTPFRAQEEQLRSLFRFEPVRIVSVDESAADSCDAMVLSLVAGEQTPAQTLRWVQERAQWWVTALTQGRSHLVTVGHHAFWAQRSGLPALVAQLSSVRSFHVRPVAPQLGARLTAPGSLVDLLYHRLAEAGHTEIERHVVLDGYQCDILVNTPTGGTAILLDQGKPCDISAARHLHLMLRRRQLLGRVEAESNLGTSRVARVLRVPAWQVRSGEPIPGLTDVK
jgi:hypothetical protein